MATYNPLSTNFKDDILADSNDRRKYTQINNSDGTISLQDSTAYKQVGSQYGAKEVNEEREAINNIYANKLVSLDEIDLVTEEGYFVDAKAVKELNSKLITGDFVQLATAGATKTQTVYKDIENINNYKMVALYCNYNSGYYCNPFICSVELFKTMTWITSDRRDNNQNYSAMLHYESDTRVKFVTVNADAALYGIR